MNASKVAPTSKAAEAPLSGRSCVYWEWAAGHPSGGEWEVMFGRDGSEKQIAIMHNGRKHLVPLHSLRLYAAPSWSKTYQNWDDLPDPVKEQVRPEYLPVTVHEYCLAADDKIYVRHEDEAPRLPPDAPTAKASRIWYVSDSPWADEEKHPTPRYVGWSN